MSVYAIDEVCYRLVREPAFRARALADLAGAIRDAGLEAAERAALLNGDVGVLHHMGAHPFLLAHLVRYGIAGLDAQKYSERIHLSDPAH